MKKHNKNKWLSLLFLSLILLTFSSPLYADTPPETKDEQSNTPEKGDIRVTKRPKLIHSVDAEYTKEAIDKRIEGTVHLQLELDANGDVNDVKVLRGLGYGLDEAAVAAAKQFKFEPAEINNQPSAVTFTFDISFALPLLPSVFEGKVVDDRTGKPVQATVTITYEKGEIKFDKPVTATTTTDPDGSFKFENVPPGTYSVKLKVDEYQNFSTDIELVSGKTSTAEYKVTAEVENVVGQVRESGTRSPLPGIEVQAIATGAQPDIAAGTTIAKTYTDSSGAFHFAGIPDGNVTLRVSSDSYLVSTENVDVTPGKVTDVTLYIQRESYDPYSVTTNAKREETTVNRRELTLKEIRKIPGTNGDVVRSVQNMPGVARAPFVSGAIIVRGSSPANTGIYVDGARIPNIFHFLLGPAVINSEMIESLDFFPGNFSTYYGHALGGIVELKTRSPKKDRIHGQFEIDLLDATVMVEGPIIKDLSFALSARRSYIDAILPAVIPKSAPLDTFVAPVYYDYQGWLTYSGLDSHTFTLKLFGSDDALAVLFSKEKAPGTSSVEIDGLNVKTGFVATQMEWKWNPELPFENDSTLTLTYQYNRVDVGPKLHFDIKGFYLQFRDDFRYKFLDQLSLRAGVEFRNIFGKLDLETPQFDDDSQSDNGGGGGRPSFDRNGFNVDASSNLADLGIYSELEIKPFRNLIVTPGLRIDYFDGIKKISPQPRVSARWTIIDGLTLKGGVGLFTQEPNRLIRSGIFTDPGLFTFQKAMQYALGVEYSPFDFLTLDVTGFYRDVWDLIGTSDEVTVKNNKASSRLFSNEGKGRAYGAEFILRHRPQNRFFGWLAYTLSWAEEYKPRIKKYEPFQFDQRHILTLVAGYNFPYDIDLGVRFRLVSGQRYTPVIGGVFNSDLDKYEKVYGEPYSKQQPPFHQLDIRVDKKFIFDTWILGLFLDIQNIYYAKNIEATTYNYDYSKSRPIYGLPIFPNIGVTGQF